MARNHGTAPSWSPPTLAAVTGTAFLLLLLAGFQGEGARAAPVCAPRLSEPPPASEGVPRLRLEPDRFDFGELLSGEKARRKVRLTNEGDGELRFEGFEFSCGCSIPRLTLSTGEVVSLDELAKAGRALSLPPGAWADVEVEFSSLGRRGRVVHHVVISSNDPAHPRKTIPIVARIRPAFSLSPRALDFGTVERGAKVSRAVTLRPAFAGDYRITGFENLPPFMSWKATQTKMGPVALTRLTLTLEEDMPPGETTLLLRARVESARTQGVALPVSFTVLPDVSFRCADREILGAVDFGILSPGGAAERCIRIHNKNPRIPYVIEGVEVEGRSKRIVAVHLDTIRPGLDYVLRITVTPRPGMRFFRAVIHLTSDHPELKHKKLDLKGLVSASGGDANHGG